jgi:hypothetical protein
MLSRPHLRSRMRPLTPCCFCLQFRQAVTGKSLKLKAENKDIDAFFATLDSDGGGSLELAELKPALKKLHGKAKQLDKEATKRRNAAEAKQRQAEEVKQLALETEQVEKEEMYLAELQNNQGLSTKLGVRQYCNSIS